MSRPPTYDDANLLLRLYEERREPRMREAREWFVKNFRFASMPEFLEACPPGSAENAFARQVTSYWEMAASLVASGILHEELFFHNTRELLLCYLRLQPLLPSLREAHQDPYAYHNLETVARRFEAWMKARAPHSFDAFVHRVR